MNITDNLIRIKEGKENIIKSLKNKGVSIADNTLINEIPTIIDNAEIGGGGDTPVQPEIPELVQKYEGASVFRINVPEDNYEFAINLCNDATKATYDVDWGDGTLEYGLTTDEQHHIYSKAGIYDVNIYNISKDITLGGGDTNSNINFLFNNSNNDSWGYNNFQKTKDLIKLYLLIGKNITSIGDNAFRFNPYLIYINLSDSVTSIGSSAFGFCRNLRYINIPNSVTTIKSHAFINCSALSSLYLPKNITKLNDYIFSGCESLTKITIPESVTSIGAYAFSNCSSLQSVNISDNITSIESYAFESCTSLTEITIPESVTSIGGYAFKGCNCLTKITIPESVTSIGGFVFYYCISLQSVEIPESVTSISSNTFSNCSSLQSVVIPNNVTSISNTAFSACYYLQSIICLNPTAPTISSSSFPTSSFRYTKRYLYVPKDSQGYTEGNWKTYLIDKGWELRYIEDKPEKTPTTLKLKTKNNFFHNLQAIGQANLIDYELIDNEYIYHFDDKITELTEYTFYNKVLEEIELPESVEIIGTYAFSKCSSLQSIVIPEGVTSIGTYAFSNCSSLQSIVIPEGVETIGECCFGDCTSLQSVVIYGGISKLEQNTFVRCSKLETIELPSTLTNIGGNTFKQTDRLSTITVKAEVAPTIVSNTFDSVGSQVPSGTPKVLRIPQNAEGYDTWLSKLSGFTIEYIPLSEL